MARINIQSVVCGVFTPSKFLLKKWARVALDKSTSEITIRIVGIPEITELNNNYRKKRGPTNVLSFTYDEPNYLGDIVICADVVNAEAADQRKTQESHWAHMIVHGVYHLLGYDHETDAEADTMEALEISTLRTLGYGNPYESRKL